MASVAEQQSHKQQASHNGIPSKAGQQSSDVKVADFVRNGSSSCGCLHMFTSQQPTNYDMLLFRTLNPMLGCPNANQDHLAAKLRDELMPTRGWWLRKVPWAKYQLRSMVENTWYGVPGCTNFIDARTKWFDQAVSSAIAGGITQVVLVAAGYDTRAYRLAPIPTGAAEPPVTFYEVDLPEASARKQALVDKLRLVPAGGSPPVYVAADLSITDLGTALTRAGFDTSKPALFTVEGLIYYLPPEAAEGLLGSMLRLAAPGSRVQFDFMHSTALEGHETSPGGFKYAGFKTTAQAVANKGESYKFGLQDSADAVAAFLARVNSRYAGGDPSRGYWELASYLGPQDMVEIQLPHIKWQDKVPPIASFYSYASAICAPVNKTASAPKS